jgi:UPF0755 protein
MVAMNWLFKSRTAKPKAAPQAIGSSRVAPKSPSEALKPVTAPPPPPKSKRRNRPFIAWLSGIFTTALVGAGLVGAIIAIISSQNNAPGPLGGDKVVIIPRESGAAEIADLLQREGVIDHPWSFRITAMIRQVQAESLKAGEYLFKAQASANDVIAIITSGRAVEHRITVPEGLTSEQILARLRENDLLTGEITQVPREGSLLPDTYKFQRGQSRQDIINRMAGEQRKILDDVWRKRPPDLPVRTPQELVILASIVEKETGRADERPRVAGVFINRMNRKMKLQSDPTIVYGLVGGKGTLGRGILRTELTQATPYNTYVIDGLPPGPIANPGRAALEAVVNHSRTKDLYFVADGTGGHTFAETLDQHNRNVLRWRQIEASRREPGRPSAEASVDRIEPPPLPDSRTDNLTGQPPRASAFAPTDGTQEIETFPASGNRTRNSQQIPQGQRSKAFDASEGTARDPLRNKTFDLNSPKTVPALRN